ncbi:uncharacterized protein LOC131620008 [Vicia villosa]|uniref:uncharacterized protein LOC131620008 n=1 Tax=Vicia villosa TaxID=3911 RepID=UPI00273C7B15|nr:uncharacterized protein LOC131620008 [Vicia villosa]
MTKRAFGRLKKKTSKKAKHSKQVNGVPKASQSKPLVQPNIHEEEVEASEAGKNKQLFNVVFHYGGEFVSLNDGVMIYRGGVTTVVTNINISTFTMIKRDDDCYDFEAYANANKVDGEMFVEHEVIDVSLTVRSLRCVNEVVQMDKCDEDGVEGLGDSEDERATALLDGFEGIDVTIPVNEAPSLSGFMRGSKKKKLEDEDEDVYVSDDLDSSNPDMSDDDKLPKFEKFRKKHFNKNFKFQWGMEFNYLDDFREAIREWSVLNGREITFVKNESYRAVVKKMQTSESVRICDIIQDMRQKNSVRITVGKAWKAKLIAKRIIEGDADKQYANLRRYAAELHMINPGNTLSITVSRPNPSIQPKFGSFYFCFDGCKKGFINGCRLFVGVDGCHLKTKYGGQLLIVVGRDPNDQYFPLEFGVVETETRDSWKWFIDLLMGDIGEDRRYVFISDQQKVILIT